MTEACYKKKASVTEKEFTPRVTGTVQGTLANSSNATRKYATHVHLLSSTLFSLHEVCKL
jgi:hypothetical protein